ncbi:MAG: 3-keto-disaccharide hydrolase, partial [Pirellulales bacterium]
MLTVDLCRAVRGVLVVLALSCVVLPVTSSPSCAVAAESESGWVHWFGDGSLEGFQVVSGTATYEIKEGVLIGTTADGSPNTFLATNEPIGNFELTFEVLVDDELNSGVQVRSHLSQEGDAAAEGSKNANPLPPGRLYGPQCEIAINGTAGDFWDEARRGNWWSELTQTQSVRSDAARAAFVKGEWNAYRIVVEGDHYRSWVNDIATDDLHHPNDPKGHIG